MMLNGFRSRSIKQWRVVTGLLMGITVYSSMVHAGEAQGLRGQRYCEVILAEKRLIFAVYNTIFLNDCPAALWNQLSENELKKETGSYFVHLNGPRFWMIDGFTDSKLINPEQRSFGGIKMRKAGLLHLNLKTILFGATPYREHAVDRTTTWVYDAGKPIYELISPDHEVYVMQSYSVQQIPQTQASLGELATKLTLPKGWQFRTGILQKQGQIPAFNNKAYVIQDNFQNTYQKSASDLLNSNSEPRP